MTDATDNKVEHEESLDKPKHDLPTLATKLDAIAQKLDECGYTADSEAVSAVTEDLLTPENPS
jgi:hypothetical protein